MHTLKRALAGLLALMMLAACGQTEPVDNPNPGSQGDTPGSEAPALENPAIDFEAAAREVIVDEDSVTFVDALGKEQTIAKHPERVAGLLNSYINLWYVAGGRIMARMESTSELDPRAVEDGTTTVGANITTINIELLIAFEPDLVIMSHSTHKDFAPILEANGIPYIAVEYNSFGDYLKYLKIFSALTGHDDFYVTKGVDLLDEINAIIAQAPEANNPTVMFMLGTTSSVKAYLSNTSVGEMIGQLGAVNIADAWEDTTATSIELNIEYLITADPDKILIQCMGDPDVIKSYIDETYGTEDWWNALQAVQNGEVHYLDRTLLHFKANDRYAEAYAELARILYPDIFA